QEAALRTMKQLNLVERGVNFASGDKSALLGDEKEVALAESWRDSPDAQNSGLVTPAIERLVSSSRALIILRRRNFMLVGIVVLLSLSVVFLGGLLYYKAMAVQLENEARSRGSVSRGVDRLEAGDVAGALLWFQEAKKESKKAHAKAI